HDGYREIAESNARFILDTLLSDGLLRHVYKDGRAKHVGFLDDYAFVVSGLVTLYETTGRTRWIEAAVRLTDKMIEEFWDEEGGGFFYNGKSGEQLIVRNKDYFDNATPSGNSVATEALLRLSVLTGKEDYRRKAVNVLRLVRDAVERYPSAFGYALCAVDFYLSTPKEVVIVPGSDEAQARLLKHELWSRYIPNKVVALSSADDANAAELIPLLRDRKTVGGRATAYVCESYRCLQPVNSAEELAAQLEGGDGRAAEG
ncbi:MAG: uncharacterized protein QOJ70_3041, partial [Acidobacteriota bacterium]|nr:uncharacterized protein [Acidobacteriota bacterium]